MRKLRNALIVCVAVGGLALTTSAMAMPIAPLNSVSQENAVAPRQARWVCGPSHCRWRPNWYGYYGYGPRFYGRPYGWHRWRHW
jgi:hypothetical protein